MANHPELTYHGGQGPILHLRSDLRATVAWAESQERRWAFSNGNAGAAYTEFYADLADLDKINWNAVEAVDFRNPAVKDGKQAEFLIHDSFPWELVEEIGVLSLAVAGRVQAALQSVVHRPAVQVEQSWYF